MDASRKAAWDGDSPPQQFHYTTIAQNGHPPPRHHSLSQQQPQARLPTSPPLDRLASELPDNRIEEVTEGPSLAKAKRYRDLTCPRSRNDTTGAYEPYTLWRCGDRDFNKYGIGTLLYFQQTRRLAWLFLLLFLCAIPSLFFNVLGSGEDGYAIMRSTLGNQGANATTTVYGFDKKTIGLINTGCDALYTIIFLLAIFVLSLLQKQATREYHASILTVSRYSVMVSNLPPVSFTREDLKQHFAQFGPVVDVSILYSNFHLVELYCDRGKLRKQLNELEHQFVEDQQKKALALQGKILTVEHLIAIERAYTGTRPVTAYVTFEKQTDSDNALHHYVDSLFFHLFMPRQFRFMGKRIRVSRAPEPSNILYHNLSYSSFNKRLRRLLTFAVSVALLSVTTAVVYVSQFVHNNKIPPINACTASTEPPSNFDVNTAAAQGFSQEVIDCYCSQLSLPVIIANHSPCQHFIETWAWNSALVLLTAVTTLVINSLIQVLVMKISQMEKHTSRSSQQKGMAKKLTAGLTLNTGVIIVAVNADLASLFQKVGADYLVNSGGFADLTPAWYSTVGQSIIITMAVGIFMPLVTTGVTLIIDWYRRTRDDLLARCKNQEELNRVFSGRSFTLDERYAMMLVTVYVSLMYSGGMPILLLIASLTFTLRYWSDKAQFVHSIKIPPRFDNQLDSLCTSWMPLAAIFHCAMSVGYYSSVCSDSYDIQDSTANSLIDDSGIGAVPLNLKGRLQQYNVLPFVILAGLLILIYCCRGLFVLLGCCGSSHADQLSTILPRYFGHYGNRPTYYEACAKVRMESYRLSKQNHWKLAYLITASRKQMEPERDFSDVAAVMQQIKQPRLSIVHDGQSFHGDYGHHSRAGSTIYSVQAVTAPNNETSYLADYHQYEPSHTQGSSVEMSAIASLSRPPAYHQHSAAVTPLPGVLEDMESTDFGLPPSYSQAASPAYPLSEHRRSASEMQRGSTSGAFLIAPTASHTRSRSANNSAAASPQAQPRLVVLHRPSAHATMSSGSGSATPTSPAMSAAAHQAMERQRLSQSARPSPQPNARTVPVSPQSTASTRGRNSTIPTISAAPRAPAKLLNSLSLQQLTAMSLADLQALWSQYDVNNDNKLGRRELKEMASDVVQRLIAVQSQHIRQSNPSLSPPEVTRAVAAELKLILPGNDEEEMAKVMRRRMLNKLDVNNDGEITRTEFQSRWNVFSKEAFEAKPSASDMECVIC